MLCALALIGWLVVGRTPVLGAVFCLTFARAYTTPLTNPTPIAETLGNVTGASKKMRPESAIGSLFNAPTMEYVVDEVTRTHHADVYEMNTDDRPDMTMAIITLLRVSGGKFCLIFFEDQSSMVRVAMIRIGIDSRLL